MQAKRIILIFILSILLVSASTCAIGPGPTPTPTPATTLTPLPIVSMSCEEARDTIQDALESYNTEYGNWPTMDGEPGDIQWTKLVPDFMTAVPANDSKCHWQVNGHPEGEVCVPKRC